MDHLLAYFTFTCRDLDLTHVGQAYADWFLGTKEPEVRARALDRGFKESWTAQDLQRGGDFEGAGGLSLRTRYRLDQWAAQLTIRDTQRPSASWTTVIRATATAQGTCIEHGDMVQGLAPSDPIPPLTTPAVLTALASSSTTVIQPTGLFRPLMRFSADQAEHLVDQVLLAADRQVPCFLVTPPSFGPATINAQDFHSFMSSFGLVLEAQDHVTANAWCDVLVRRGLPRELGAYNGAVRVYEPGLNSSASPYSHPLYTKNYLNTIGYNAQIATRVLARTIAKGRSQQRAPAAYFQAIDLLDRSETSAHFHAEAAKALDIHEVRLLLAEALEENKHLVALTTEQEATIYGQRAALSIREDLERQRVNELQGRVDHLQDVLDARHADQGQGGSVSAQMDAQTREVMQRRIADGYSVADVLRALEVLYLDRLVVLPPAHSSASESSDFTHPDLAASLLWRLIVPYRDALVAGTPDSEAKNFFGKNQYSAKESDGLSRRGHDLRTFTYLGKPVQMHRHLKIGTGTGTATCLRVHFAWDASTGRIVIGYCGRHLDFK